ncbi:MAG: peptidoglycan DD-metalloendopeptidase family protein [Bacteroidetes bacterium]|nr:peptidoglycan DD-metalloendopeptidase family protein [Bacteroidota bacterium]
MNTKKQELNRLRGNIKLYERKIAESNKKETTSLGALDLLERQNLKARQMIKKISDDMAKNSNLIDGVEGKISEASTKLDDLRGEYARFARAFYEQGRMHDLELILTASSVNEMLVRYEYLKRFSDQTKVDLNSISSEKAKLSDLREQLHQQMAKQQSYLGRKRSEEKMLASRIVEHRRLIGRLRKDKKVYAQQLRRSQNAAAELERLIRNLIAAESGRKREERNATRRPPASPSAIFSRTLSTLKGHLPWPVVGGRVVAKFGEHENPVLKTVTLNYGIDISVPENTQVRSVADGQVSRIFWLPSYGNLIIINNYNGLRTVYSHLSDIFVKEGDKVKADEPIGTVGESLSGSILHFEVWVNTNKQDPETWLSKR